MAQLVFTEEELLASHPYHEPQRVAGHRLHGGYDVEGRYIPPRTLHRGRAIAAWTQQLRSRGGELLRADSSLLAGIRFPSPAQQKLLLRKGLGESFWNTLTITGKIEARGRMLAEISFPDLQSIIEEDVSEMGIGHLNGGLLKAHGLDEGGEPERGIGGHDVMWFALRDLAFGEHAFRDVDPPERIGRDPAEREAPEIPAEYEQLIRFLLNLLLIEFRAELGFALAEEMLRDPELFRGRRAEAEEAADVVGRIRADEEIHVSSLRLYLGELRSVSLRTVDGGRIGGHEIVDRLWGRLVHWATVEQPKLAAEQQRAELTRRILAHPQGERILAEFEALADEPAPST